MSNQQPVAATADSKSDSTTTKSTNPESIAATAQSEPVVPPVLGDAVPLRHLIGALCSKASDTYSDLIESLQQNINSNISTNQQAQQIHTQIHTFVHQQLLQYKRLHAAIQFQRQHTAALHRLSHALYHLQLSETRFGAARHALQYLASYVQQCLYPQHDVRTALHVLIQKDYKLLPHCVTSALISQQDELKPLSQSIVTATQQRLCALMSCELMKLKCHELMPLQGFVSPFIASHGMLYLTLPKQCSIGLSLRMGPRLHQQSKSEELNNSASDIESDDKQRIVWRLFELRIHIAPKRSNKFATLNHSSSSEQQHQASTTEPPPLINALQTTQLLSHLNNTLPTSNAAQFFITLQHKLQCFSVQLILQLCEQQMRAIVRAQTAAATGSHNNKINTSGFSVCADARRSVQLDYWPQACLIAAQTRLASQVPVHRLIVRLQQNDKTKSDANIKNQQQQDRLIIEHTPHLSNNSHQFEHDALEERQQHDNYDSTFLELDPQAIDVQSIFRRILQRHANQRLHQLYVHLQQLTSQRQAIVVSERARGNNDALQEEQLLYSNCTMHNSTLRLTLAPDHVLLIRCDEQSGNFTLHWDSLLPLLSASHNANESSLAYILAEEQQRLRLTLQPLQQSLLRLRRAALLNHLKHTLLLLPLSYQCIDNEMSYFAPQLTQPSEQQMQRQLM
jgi:hypothetical protein